MKFIDLLITIFILIGFVLVMWASFSKQTVKEKILEIIEWLDNLDSDVTDVNPLEVVKK